MFIHTLHESPLITDTQTSSTLCMVTFQRTHTVAVLICPAGDCLCFSLDPSPLKFVQSYMEFVFSALTFVLFCLCVRFCGWVCGSVCVSVRERETLIFNLSVCLHPILCVHSPGVDVFQPCGDR